MIVRTNVPPPAVYRRWLWHGLQCTCGQRFAWRSHRRYREHLVAEHPPRAAASEPMVEPAGLLPLLAGRGVDWCPSCGSENKFIRGQVPGILMDEDFRFSLVRPPQHLDDGTCNDEWHYQPYPR